MYHGTKKGFPVYGSITRLRAESLDVNVTFGRPIGADYEVWLGIRA